MFLKSLDIFGFKSFADKTHIDFADGITALLGPNGCGKSNVVDAIKWVLAENRSKNLRAEKMEDVCALCLLRTRTPVWLRHDSVRTGSNCKRPHAVNINR